MIEDNQIVIPPSFIALFIEPGRIKPTASKEHILDRYDFCEDLANMLTETAATKLWELGITESDVLNRIHQGLSVSGIGISEDEAKWVMTRLAELMGWLNAD